MNHSSMQNTMRALGLAALLAAIPFGGEAMARVIVGGGVIVGGPAYYYPPYYGYSYAPYYAYPPAYAAPYPPPPAYAEAPPSPPPAQYYRDSQGEYCREYSRMATIDGRQERVYGHACRQPDGTWRTVD